MLAYYCRSCHLKVEDLDNTNYNLHVSPLHEDILSEGSHFKVRNTTEQQWYSGENRFNNKQEEIEEFCILAASFISLVWPDEAEFMELVDQ